MRWATHDTRSYCCGHAAMPAHDTYAWSHALWEVCTSSPR
jgi:hypothetical protein